jgi:ubiquitin-protein ligase E3 A
MAQYENFPQFHRKRAAARQLIERYYYQLTDGCGRSTCSNVHCASCPSFGHASLSPNEAALTAIRLAKEKASLCELSKPSKVAKSTEERGAGPSSAASVSSLGSTSQQGSSVTNIPAPQGFDDCISLWKNL